MQNIHIQVASVKDSCPPCILGRTRNFYELTFPTLLKVALSSVGEAALCSVGLLGRKFFGGSDESHGMLVPQKKKIGYQHINYKCGMQFQEVQDILKLIRDTTLGTFSCKSSFNLLLRSQSSSSIVHLVGRDL